MNLIVVTLAASLTISGATATAGQAGSRIPPTGAQILAAKERAEREERARADAERDAARRAIDRARRDARERRKSEERERRLKANVDRLKAELDALEKSRTAR